MATVYTTIVLREEDMLTELKGRGAIFGGQALRQPVTIYKDVYVFKLRMYKYILITKN